MLSVLLESCATRQRRAGSTMASAAMHGIVIAAAVGLASPHPGGAVTRPQSHRSVVFVPVHPETRDDQRTDRRAPGTSSQTGRRTITLPNFTTTELPPIDLALPERRPSEPTSVPSDGFPTGPGFDVGLRYSGEVLDERAVDRAPQTIGRAPEPRYPTALRDAGIQGRVVAEFVVDTLGRAEMDGLKLDAPQALFGESVRAVLPRYRFSPGEAAGRKVRTRVQLPFDFTLAR